MNSILQKIPIAQKIQTIQKVQTLQNIPAAQNIPILQKTHIIQNINPKEQNIHCNAQNIIHSDVVNKLKTLVQEERKITIEILTLLRTVEIEKVFAHMGYPSHFEFCTKELGYSEGAAQRRISAMRLIKEIPEAKEKIESGALSLSVVSQIQSFFKKKKSLNKPMSQCEKWDLLTSLENSSTRNCEKTLLQMEPEIYTKDRERFVDADTLEIKITVDKEFISHLEILKNQLSHKMPFATTKDILSLALRELVKKLSFGGCTKTKRSVGDSLDNECLAVMNLVDTSLVQKHIPPAPAVEKSTVQKSTILKPIEKSSAVVMTLPIKATRYIPTKTKRMIWANANGRCCYIHPITKQRCGSKRFLEIDHIFPKSLGGSNNADNLRLLCDAHNRLKGAAIVEKEFK